MQTFPVTEFEINKIVQYLQNKTSTGYENFSKFRASRPTIVPTQNLADLPIKTTNFLRPLIKALDHSLYKEESKLLDAGNYRPIFEPAMRNRVYEYLEINA